MRLNLSKRRGVGVVAIVLATSCGDDATSSDPATSDAAADTATRGDSDARTDEAEAMADAAAEVAVDRLGDASVDTAVDATSGESGDQDGTVVEAGHQDGALVEAGGDAGVVEAGPLPPLTCDGPGSRFVTDIVSYRFGEGQEFGRAEFPANVFGPPKGEGCCMGSLDVVSLGDGGTVTVAFTGNGIVDGPGPDFVVFENAFNASGDLTRPYAELGTVEVSQDGLNWVAFPCTATSYPYGMCAGWRPVFANADKNQIDPTDPVLAGGDPFDLSDVGLQSARQVRITDRIGDAFIFDLDAVAIVHPICP